MTMSENIPSHKRHVILRKSENEREIVEIPHFVSKTNKSKSTLSTSLESSPSRDFPIPKEIVHLSMQQEQSDEDSIESDISGLTGCFSSMKPIFDPVGNNEGPLMKPFPYPETSFQSMRKTDPVGNNEEPRMKHLPYPETSFQSMRKTAPDHKRKKAVRFSTVRIREYERILGDNPSCTSGPSVGIGWRHIQEELLSVNEWESWREMGRRPDRLVLCREEREEMLLDLGYTEKDIAAAVRENVRSKNKRLQTVQNLSASVLEEVAEGAKKRVKGLLTLRKKKTKEILPVQSDNQKRKSRGTNIMNHADALTCIFGNKYRGMDGEENLGSFLDETLRMQSEPQNVVLIRSDDVRIMRRNSLTLYSDVNRSVPRNTRTGPSDSISSGSRNFARIPIEVSLPSSDEALNDEDSQRSKDIGFVDMHLFDDDETFEQVGEYYA